MSVEAIKTPKTENVSEQVAKRRVGITDIIAAVSKALLGDIFVRIACRAWKGWTKCEEDLGIPSNPLISMTDNF